MTTGARDDRGARAVGPASIGRQLHDIVVPQLFVLTTGLTALSRTEDPEAASRLIDDLTETAAQSLADLRSISRGHLVHEGGRLQQVIPRLRIATQMVARLSGVEVDVTADGDADVSAGLDDDLRAVVWEALANAIRHGGADRIDVALQAMNDKLHVVVVDNGTWREPDRDDGTGIGGLRERAEQRGGQLSIHRGAFGTRLDWEVPLVTSWPCPSER